MKVYRVELMVIDFEGTGEDDLRDAIENTKYINPKVISMAEREIGEWDDENPLNKRDTQTKEFRRLFGG